MGKEIDLKEGKLYMDGHFIGNVAGDGQITKVEPKTATEVMQEANRLEFEGVGRGMAQAYKVARSIGMAQSFQASMTGIQLIQEIQSRLMQLKALGISDKAIEVINNDARNGGHLKVLDNYIATIMAEGQTESVALINELVSNTPGSEPNVSMNEGSDRIYENREQRRTKPYGPGGGPSEQRHNASPWRHKNR